MPCTCSYAREGRQVRTLCFIRGLLTNSEFFGFSFSDENTSRSIVKALSIFSEHNSLCSNARFLFLVVISHCRINLLNVVKWYSRQAPTIPCVLLPNRYPRLTWRNGSIFMKLGKPFSVNFLSEARRITASWYILQKPVVSVA